MPMVRPFIFEQEQTLGIMRPMNPLQVNPIVDSLVPSDFSAPVVNIAPYGPSAQIGGVGSVQDAVNVLQLTDLLLGA